MTLKYDSLKMLTSKSIKGIKIKILEARLTPSAPVKTLKRPKYHDTVNQVRNWSLFIFVM